VGTGPSTYSENRASSAPLPLHARFVRERSDSAGLESKERQRSTVAPFELEDHPAAGGPDLHSRRGSRRCGSAHLHPLNAEVRVLLFRVSDSLSDVIPRLSRAGAFDRGTTDLESWPLPHGVAIGSVE